MKENSVIEKLYLENLTQLIETAYSHNTIKKKPVEWIEENMYIPSSASKIAGFASYNYTPYVRDLINHLHGSDPVESIAIMKCAQSGFTTMLVVAGIIYIIAEDPAPIFFMAETDIMASGTIKDRFDPILYESGLGHLIRPTVQKKKNNSTGDTALKKQFGGGSLTISGANPGRLRQFSVKNIFADDLDAAPRSDEKEGDIRSLLEKRATSYGDSKKLFYISTPTVQGASNIEDLYLEGDQRKWHWECPHCLTYIAIEFRIETVKGEYAGLKWELDENKRLIEDSIHYECQCCGGKIYERDKTKLNNTGKWIPTATPDRPNKVSYQLNALVIPSSFDGWKTLVYEWLQACPPGGTINQPKLKAFLNTRLGQTWKDEGKTPKVSVLMNNTGAYNINLIPDITCEREGNKGIVLITLSCDLGGVMNDTTEDVRIDYEIVAHTLTGVTYSIDHGSIGNFIKTRERTKEQTKDYNDLKKYTYAHNQHNSVWPELLSLIQKTYIGESGKEYNINLTLIDSSFFTRSVYEFIKVNTDELIVAIKGYVDPKLRNINKDTELVKRSKENHNLYILQVNQLKDMLHHNMNLKAGVDGYQPYGFMNYPTPEKGKYTMRSYFKHFEGEHRVEEKKEGQIVGYTWKKKHADVINHFWDTAVYNLAAPHIFMDFIKRSDRQRYGQMTWTDYCYLLAQN